MTTSHHFDTEPVSDTEQTPLRRCLHRRMIAGVAAGVANYLGVDLTLVRIGFVALTVFGALGIPMYLACWLLIPEEGSDRSVAEELIDQFELR